MSTISTIMYKLILLVLCLSIFGATISKAGMPRDLSKMLNMEEDLENPEPAANNLKEELKKEPGTLISNEFDLNKFISQSPRVEAARRKLIAGDIEIYKPAKITAVECHVEFQVTERVPGRCTRLAGSIPACQAENYIGINYNECN